MFMILLLGVLGLILLGNANSKLRKSLAYVVLGVTAFTFVYTGLNLTTSKSSVSVQSPNVVVGDMENHHHEKQQRIP